MVAAEERVRPRARARERVVLDDDRTVEHRLLLAVRLQPLVRLRPDALGVVHLAQSLAGAAARAVALVLRTLRLGTHVRDVGQRAVAAVAAAEQRDLRRLLQAVGDLPGCRRLLHRAVEGAAGGEERRVRLERGGVQAPAEPVLHRHGQIGLPLRLRVEVRSVDHVGRQLRVRVALEEVELVRERILDLRRERAPVVRRERLGALEDLAEPRRRHVPAEIDAGEAEPARDRHMLCRQLGEELAALVGARAVPLGEPSSSSVTITPGILPLLNARAAAGDRR